MKNNLTLLWLCSLALALSIKGANAQEPDFSMFEPQEMTANADGICFDVFGAETPCPEQLNFAMLAPTCRCADTGQCTCPAGECVCEKQSDDRPLITVDTMKDCPPCNRLKDDSTTDALKGFRFQFIEHENVPGGAPRIEWQGIEGKCWIHGYLSPESLKRHYEISQSKKSMPSAQISYRPMPVVQMSVATCAGGRCR